MKISLLVLSIAAVSIMSGCTHKTTVSKTTEGQVSSTATASSEVTVTGEAPPAPTRAQAILKPGKDGKVKGLIHFTIDDDKMKIETMVEGLKPGPHGFHIHEVGDCSKADFSSAGGHFNINSHSHGSLNSARRHAGDLGNLIANAKGVAKATFLVEGLTFEAGPGSIIGRSIIIHADKDDFKSQPAGNSGARVACGLIQGL